MMHEKLLVSISFSPSKRARAAASITGVLMGQCCLGHNSTGGSQLCAVSTIGFCYLSTEQSLPRKASQQVRILELHC